MKSMPILLCIVAAVLFILFGCTTSAAPEVSLRTSCDYFIAEQNISEELEIAVDGSLTVTLCSNPTTGFQWSEPRIIDKTILIQTEHRFLPPEAEEDSSPALGIAGTEVWTFKALKEGTSSVFMEYSQPWEGGEKGVWKFNLFVVVR
ncbi:MAG: hypothetical protein A2Y60_00480 [Chloroflexi bacterium RBG_13_54_9]|nr:MAG: hypothetical protein A2Y60_00480 [Chloroflexi bacterium RBG_13_54_9]